MKQRKILFIDHTAVLGGAELSLLDLAAAYRQNSQVLLFSDGPFKNKLESKKVKVETIEGATKILALRTSSGLEALMTIPKLWRMAEVVAQKSTGFELIHANSQKAFIISALATFRGSPPVVWYLHDILTAKHFSSLNRTIAVALANRCAAKVIVNSRATGEAFVAAGGKSKLVDVVYNGFNSEPFDRVSTQDITETRRHLGLESVFLVGLFSRLSYWKGQHILLKAIKELPEVHALLVGDVLFGEEEYASELKTLAADPKLQNRVHWLGFRDDVPTLMKACDVVVHTSTEPEPFGRVIVEGQLARRPIIASAAGGALELVEDGVSGCLFTPGDPTSLQQKINLLIQNRDLAQSLGQQGYSSARHNFALTTILDSYERALVTTLPPEGREL